MDHIMNEETRKRLKGMLPFSEKTTVSFTPECYAIEGLEEQFRPVFRLRGLTRSEHMELVRISKKVVDASEGGKEPSGDVATEQLSVVRSIIVGWERMYGGDGQIIPFEKDDDGFCTASVFWSLHYSVHLELINKMYEISGMSNIEKVGLKS